MILKKVSLFCLLALLIMPVSASAQDITDELTKEEIDFVIQNADLNKAAMDEAIAELKAAGEYPVPDEEFDPTYEEKVMFIERGLISAYADWCGFDSKDASFLPFMVQEQKKEYMTNPEAEYFMTLHAMTKKQYDTVLASRGECTDEDKEAVKAHLYKEIMRKEDDVPLEVEQMDLAP